MMYKQINNVQSFPMNESLDKVYYKVYSESLLGSGFSVVLFLKLIYKRTKINNHFINQPHFIYKCGMVNLISS